MPTVVFTENIQRHISCPTVSIEGTRVFEALESAFRENPNVRGYVQDDRGAIWKHVVILWMEQR